MRFLIDHKADVNLKEPNGWPPITGLINKPGSGTPPLLAMIRLLLEHRAEVDARGTGPEKPTALMMACGWVPIGGNARYDQCTFLLRLVHPIQLHARGAVCVCVYMHLNREYNGSRVSFCIPCSPLTLL